MLIWVIICYRSHLLQEPKKRSCGENNPLAGWDFSFYHILIKPVGPTSRCSDVNQPTQTSDVFCYAFTNKMEREQQQKKHICSVLRVGGQTLAGGQWKMMGCWVSGVNCDWIPWVFPYTSKYPLMFGVLGMFWGSSHTEPQKVWMSRVLQLRTWRHAMVVATKFGSTIFGWASCESLGGWYIHRIH